ncbi:diphosphomevalonate decarboxylase [Schleiferia thermophila]
MSEPITAHWHAPSNIAIVKYWGKFHNQIPANPSISFTLTLSYTDTKVTLTEAKEQLPTADVFYEGVEKPDFLPKVLKFLDHAMAFYPWLARKHLKIETRNTFPHSSGIASSASAIAALACCIEDIHSLLTFTPFDRQRVSHMARLGSGSACRSIYGGFVQWGSTADGAGSDHFAIPVEQVHTAFLDVKDYILILHSGKKTVSSSAGHGLMKDHSYAEPRFQQAKQRALALRDILTSGDWEMFIRLMESEALTLHAMMMTSDPPYILMKPNTLAVIEKLWQFRSDTGYQIGFTLDAGANLHLIFPASLTHIVERDFLPEIQYLCEQNRIIRDCIGDGPRKITEG